MVYNWLNTQRLQKNDKGNKNTPYRSDFDRDYGRITHSSSFRRLQGKTQVWGGGETDFFRNRLTHSLEVAQIGVGITKIFNFYYRKFEGIKNEHLEVIPDSLMRSCCLAHDIGHPPLGHDGEKVLDTFARKIMSLGEKDQKQMCFDGNAQNLRILLQLESPYPGQRGLNLTAGTLDGIIKYKRQADGLEKSGYYWEDAKSYNKIIEYTKTNGKRNPLVMLVELADDIAYSTHDLQDAMRSGFITQRILHNWLENCEWCSSKYEESESSIILKLLNKILKKSIIKLNREEYRNFQKLFLARIVHELIEMTSKSLSKETIFYTIANMDYGNDIKTNIILEKNKKLKAWLKCFKGLAKEKVFDHPNLKFKKATGKSLLNNYLERYADLIEGNSLKKDMMFQSLPKILQKELDAASGKRARLRLILDYVSGMTDDFFMLQASAFNNPILTRAISYPF